MTLRRMALVALISLVPAARAGSQDTPALRHGIIFGTFSDLSYNEESGDLLGTEITVVPQYRFAYAIFQCAEGAPTDPVLVPVHVAGDRITFTISGDGMCPGSYAGVATPNGMTLSVRTSGSQYSNFLPRRKSYWGR